MRVAREYTDPDWGNPSTTKFAAPPFKPSADASAFPPDPNDPSTGLKFNTSAGTVAPFVLLPYTKPANSTEGTPDAQGFLQLPAKMVEPLFRNFWTAQTPKTEVVAYKDEETPNASTPSSEDGQE